MSKAWHLFKFINYFLFFVNLYLAHFLFPLEKLVFLSLIYKNCLYIEVHTKLKWPHYLSPSLDCVLLEEKEGILFAVNIRGGIGHRHSM